MKKITVVALFIAFLLGACLPTPAPNNQAPVVDIAGTVNAIAKLAIAETLTAQPSPTELPPSPTSLPTDVPTDTPILVDATGTNTETPIPNLTTTPATATSGPGGTMAPTSTTLPSSGGPTLTPTLGVLLYGTLPPKVPYNDIYLSNVSRREAYISLVVRTALGGHTALEYPVKRWPFKINAPTGDYSYVAWVGGRQIVGYFHLGKTSLDIVIYKDKVEISSHLASYP